jgi:hypothetical protein
MYPEEVDSPHGLTLERSIEISAELLKFHAKEIQRLQAELQRGGGRLPRWLGHFISCFIPKKKNRRRFREKYVRGK